MMWQIQKETRFCWIILLWMVCLIKPIQAGDHGNQKGDPLFAPTHPNITYLTDQNWHEMMAKTDKPWLVDFYHPL
jgi:hypothetical protein